MLEGFCGDYFGEHRIKLFRYPQYGKLTTSDDGLWFTYGKNTKYNDVSPVPTKSLSYIYPNSFIVIDADEKQKNHFIHLVDGSFYVGTINDYETFKGFASSKEFAKFTDTNGIVAYTAEGKRLKNLLGPNHVLNYIVNYMHGDDSRYIAVESDEVKRAFLLGSYMQLILVHRQEIEGGCCCDTSVDTHQSLIAQVVYEAKQKFNNIQSDLTTLRDLIYKTDSNELISKFKLAFKYLSDYIDGLSIESVPEEDDE